MLQRDLAYAEYLGGGGTASLEGSAAAERMRGIVASTAHAMPTLISAAHIAEVSSRLLGRFPVLGAFDRRRS